MPRRLDSVNQGGYVEEIRVDEGQLDRVVAMLGLTDPQRTEAARYRIFGRLEDLKTARSRTAKVKPIRTDTRDLNDLRKAMDLKQIKDNPCRAQDALESLRTSNPVLHRRLQSELRRHGFHVRLMAVEHGADPIEPIANEIILSIESLKEQIREEDGRGASTDYPSRAFASALFSIWTEFTGRGTSRQNAFDRERDPFGDFVDAAGKLIEPDFNGHHVARQIHEASRDEVEAES